MHDAAALPAAVAAFDAAAERFDERFGDWRSVAAQRRAVRRYLLDTFADRSHLLELAGGTAEDALFLAAHGRRVTLTDGAPSMVARASSKVAAAGMADRITVQQLLLEQLHTAHALSDTQFDGAYSNFAGLNCVRDLPRVARGLARLLPARAAAILVVFGPFAPGEVAVQLARGDVRAAFRRLRRHEANARLGGRSFHVHYATPATIAAAFAPWFELRHTRGIGVFVPPSAAEPFISRWPRTLHVLEALDRLMSVPLALLGDHVLLHFERTSSP